MATSQLTFCAHCSEVLLHDQTFCTRCGAATQVGAGFHPHAGAYGCFECGGNGQKLAPKQNVCGTCRWLRPLAPDYHMPLDAFQWNLDRNAMDTLRGIGPLSAAASALSSKISRPWFEASVNGIRLGPDQLPDIYHAAVFAARVLALPRMPEIYVSGEQMWDCICLGGDDEAFIVVGSVLTALKGADLAFLLGRQMGHVAAGHALWKSVLRFLSGTPTNRTIMGNGVLQFLNPSKLIESAIDAPLMAWARHAEITADRAGAMVVGNRAVIRRVLSQWSLKSFPLYNRLNQDALDREIAISDDQIYNLSEWTMSSTPYLARRLKLMDAYLETDMLRGWRAIVEHWTRPKPAAPPPPDPNIVRLTCVTCGEPMRVAKKDLAGKEKAKVKCPNTKCGKVLEIAPKPPDKAQVKRILQPPPAGLKVSCPACKGSMVVPAAAMKGKTEINVRCPTETCRKVLTVKLPDEPAAAASDRPEKEAKEPKPRPPRLEETAD